MPGTVSLLEAGNVSQDYDEFHTAITIVWHLHCK
jgi:hypothetical protein